LLLIKVLFMHRKILSQVDLYYGDVKMPKNFEIDRTKIKEQIIYSSFISDNRKNNDKNDKRYNDFIIDDTTILYPLHVYFSDFINLKFDLKLILQDSWGNIVYPGQQTNNRNTLNPLSLDLSSDYTLIYGVDVYDKESKLIIEYDSNRRAGRSWTIPIFDNSFVMFPSTCRYHISQNMSKNLNTFLGFTFNYV